MSRRRKIPYRLIIIGAILLALVIREIAIQQHPSFLRPGLKLCAYVANSGDGTVSVVDLVSLSVRATISVGAGPASVRAHPTRKEIWGVSSSGGYAWILDTQTNQVVARIPVGAAPYSLDFSPDGQRAYVAASGADMLTAIDCDSRKVIATAKTGRAPWNVRPSDDGNFVAVANRDDATLEIFNAEDLAPGPKVPVAAQPAQIVISKDSSTAFVEALGTNQISVVDLKRGLLLGNLPLPGKPSQMLLKPDGGELYVLVPEAHELVIINTWTHEVVETVVVGSLPMRGAISSDGAMLYIADAAAGHILALETAYRSLQNADAPVIVGSRPGPSELVPGGDLLVTVDEGSNDLAVVRIRNNVLTLVTLVPVGPAPSDLAIKLF